jgi:DNA-damage-inducible protein J
VFSHKHVFVFETMAFWAQSASHLNFLEFSGIFLLCMLHCSSKEIPSMTNTVVRARIDERVKEEAAAVLATIGLTVSDAFRLMMMRIAKDKALPFEPLIPNAETIEAMLEARRGEGKKFASIDALFADLNAGD